MYNKNKMYFSLISLFIAQFLILFFSFHWLIKYYQDTLIAEFNVYQIFMSFGKLGIVSLCFSVFIILIIVYQLFFKKDRPKAVLYLNFLFIVSLAFFILQRLYGLLFMSYNLLIVLNTFVWTDLFYLACLSSIGIILGVMILFAKGESARIEL